MKRSSVLFALVVGLSLTAAATASAAGPAAANAAGPARQEKAAAVTADKATDKNAVRQVAQNGTGPSSGLNQQSTDSSTPAPPSNAPGAGDSTGSPTQPGVTVGTPTAANPTSDTPQGAASEAGAKPKRRPFAGSSLFISNSMTTNTIFKGQTQYNDPTVESNLYITPRFAINDALQLRARLIVSYEWTNSDENTYNHEPTLSDTTLQLFYRKIPQLPGGIQPAVALNAALPTSKNSRARTMYVTPGATLQLVKGFEHFLGGELSIIGSVTYSHPLYKSRNPETLDPRPVPFQCLGGNGCSDLLSGTMNVSDNLSYSLIVSPEWGKWNPAIAYIGGSAWAYHPTATVNPIDGKPMPVNSDATNYRQTHYLSAWLDYNFTAWITGEIGYWNATSGIGADGQRANIIFNRYQDTRVYLGASIQLDNLVKSLQGTSEGAAGVVRAQAKPPMFSF